VQNLSTFPISVHVSLYGTAGGPAVLTFSDTIPGDSNHQYNLKAGGNVPYPEIFEDNLPNPFLGTAKVTSTHPIVGAASGVRVPSGGLAGAYLGVPGGTNKLVYPAIFRVKNGPKWTNYSSVAVQNIDPNDSVDVTVKFMNSDGTVGFQFGDTIPANSLHGYSTRYGGSAPGGATAFETQLGDSWSGSVVVTADDPVITGVATNQTMGTGYTYMAVYNAVFQ
jgi:hypothetical protein